MCLCCTLFFFPSTWEQRLRLSIFFFANSVKSHHGYAIIAQCCCHGTNEGQWNEAIAEWREGWEETHMVFGLHMILIYWGNNVEQGYCNIGRKRTMAWTMVSFWDLGSGKMVWASYWFLLVFLFLFVLFWGLRNWVLVDREQWSLGWISMRSWSRSVEEHLERLFLFTTRLRRRSNSHHFLYFIDGATFFCSWEIRWWVGL